MVQTSQTNSFVPKRAPTETDGHLLRLHRAEATEQLSQAVFGLVEHLVPHRFCILLFRHLEFDLPCLFKPIKYKIAIDAYMERHHKHDIWLKRSPVHPGVTVVRHGDHTPLHVLRRSAFYHNVLHPLRSLHGASVVAWRSNVWLATLTIMRSERQGEFTDEHMEELAAIHPHFETVIHRMAGQHEKQHVSSSVQRFISGLEAASFLLDWNLKPLHYSTTALKLCARWTHGARASVLKLPRTLLVPADIRAIIEKIRPSLTQPGQPRRARPRKPSRMIHLHPRDSTLEAAIEFMPSNTMSIGKGNFLITLDEKPPPGKRLGVSQKLKRLSPRERECAFLAAEGLHNDEIAQRLGKSPITVRNQLTSIYQKLSLTNRHKLIAAFAQLEGKR
jgi:DNA-binding CsgD family transcriptional regulator